MKKPDLKTMEEILDQYELFEDIIPCKGEINYETQRITLNPLFNRVESLAYAMFNHYYDITVKTGATEWLVRESAKEVIKNQEVSDLMKKYLEKSKKMPTRDLFRIEES